jgi:hypothetical protein
MRCANQTQPHPFPEQAHWKLLKAAGDVSSPSPSFEVETAIFGWEDRIRSSFSPILESFHFILAKTR